MKKHTSKIIMAVVSVMGFLWNFAAASACEAVFLSHLDKVFHEEKGRRVASSIDADEEVCFYFRNKGIVAAMQEHAWLDDSAFHISSCGHKINLRFLPVCWQDGLATEFSMLFCSACAQTIVNYMLAEAVNHGCEKLIHFSLDHGADVDVQDATYGLTPLHWAVKAGNALVVRVLLTHSADKNAKSKASGNTPLHYAAMHGQVRVVRMLLEYGADKNLKNKQEKTAYALASGAYRIAIQTLLKPTS